MPDIYVARQPIYDGGLQAHGYELLFRRGTVDDAEVVDGDQATSQVIVSTFTEIGFERLVGRRRAFVNVTRAFATGELPLPFPPDRTALKILESIEIDGEVVRGARRLAASGYPLALDDVAEDLAAHPLMPIASYVKIDVHQHDEEAQLALLATCRSHRVQTIAEKVETREEFAAAAKPAHVVDEDHRIIRVDAISVGQSMGASTSSSMVRISPQAWQAPPVPSRRA